MAKNYTIHEVADLFGLSTDAIRLYEKEGLVTPMRDPSNGYRYYHMDQIHRIMGILLYRKLDVSLVEIKKLLHLESFPDTISHYGTAIAETEKEILRLQQTVEKMKIMQSHLIHLSENIDVYSVKDMPEYCVIYHNETRTSPLKDMKSIFHSPCFSFGHFCYEVSLQKDYSIASRHLLFTVNMEMMPITPWKDAVSALPTLPAQKCIYTVATAKEHESVASSLPAMLAYASSQGLSCKPVVYAFYVYTMQVKDEIKDYYEIYLPIA